MILTLAQINPTVGDLAGNAGLILEHAGRAAAAGVDLVVYPELALCGYPPKDLLLAEGFVAACERWAADVAARAPGGVTLVFGTPLAGRAGVQNGLVVCRGGQVVARYAKRLLPTYDVFDEDRYFVPGDAAVVVEVPGRDGVVRVGLSVCEDLWKGEDAGFAQRYLDQRDPVEDLVAAGAQVIVNPSASPFVLGKGRRHREILSRHAARHGVVVAAVNQVGGNDDLIFDGHSAVFGPDGSLVAAWVGFETPVEACGVSVGGASGKFRATVPGAGPVADPLLSAAEEELAFRALVLGVRDYCRKTGFVRAILGLSGGIDSALTAVVAAAALGPSNVLGVGMPGPYSSEHSVSDARDLAERLGVSWVVAPIGPAFTGAGEVLEGVFASLSLPRLGAVLPDLTEENLQSRVRGTVLMGLSNRTGAIVLTTGNKSEMAVGYCTLYGDMNGGLAVLSDLSKNLVYRVSRWMNREHGRLGFAGPPIPEGSLEKPPSAELRPNQTDQDSLPPYDVLDEVLRRYVEVRQDPVRIAAETGFDAGEVRRVCRLIDLSEYKRKQAATGLKVTTVAFGSGRRVPIRAAVAAVGGSPRLGTFMAKKPPNLAVMAAFLRGVNVGGKNKVPMAELREVFESLGHTEVSTYIASGNVLFRSATPAGEVAGLAAAAILKAFKVNSPVVVRTQGELAAAIAAAPFQGDESRVLIGFCAAKPKGSPDPARSPHDQVAVVGREVHLSCPRGVSESKFTSDYLDRTLGTTVTFRNLRTCREVLARLAAMGG